ncbi:MAG: hypothetical protein K6L76_12455 [Agarilytica sp.]
MPPTCEVIDVTEIQENNVTNCEVGPGFIIDWANGGTNVSTFWTAGDYVLQVYAEDVNGEFHYSRNIEFTVEFDAPWFTDTNQNHLLSGRDYPFGFQYSGIGTNEALGSAYVETSLRSDFPGF